MKTVLVVDDHSDTNEIVCKLIQKLGYQTLSAHTGEAALALLATEPADLVLLDSMMPGMNGSEVLRVIRGNPHTATLPVIIHTAIADEEARQNALDKGANEYIVKSGFDLAAFESLLARYL